MVGNKTGSSRPHHKAPRPTSRSSGATLRHVPRGVSTIIKPRLGGRGAGREGVGGGRGEGVGRFCC